MKKAAYIIILVFFATSYVFPNEEVKIGAIFGKTGEVSIWDMRYIETLRLAVQEINAGSGLLNRQIKLIEFDNKSSALGAKIAAKNAVKEGVIGVIGADYSSHSLAIAPILQKAKIPMISNYSTAEEVTLVGDFIFRVCYTDSFQGFLMANFAYKDLKAKKAVILTNANSTYSIGLSRVFKNQFCHIGGQILWSGDYLDTATDFKNIIIKFKTLNPDIVFLPGYVRDSAFIIKQTRKMGCSVVFLGADGWSDDQYKYAGESIDGSYYCTHWHFDSPNKISRKLIQMFKKKYNKEFNDPGIALVYDAIYLLVDAIKRANSFDTTKIRDSIAATKNFIGATGKITMDKNGDPKKSAVILQFNNGKSKFIKNIDI